MIYSVLKIERPVRRRLKRNMQRSLNREHDGIRLSDNIDGGHKITEGGKNIVQIFGLNVFAPKPKLGRNAVHHIDPQRFTQLVAEIVVQIIAVVIPKFAAHHGLCDEGINRLGIA